MTTHPITQEVLGAADGAHFRNAWPDMPIVKVTPVPVDNPYAVYDFGVRLGQSTLSRQVRSTNIPGEVPLHDTYRPYYKRDRNSLVTVHFVYSGAMGQADDLRGRHILALIPPGYRWDQSIKGNRIVTPGTIVTLGCAHDYTVTLPTGRSTYRRGVCSKCGHTYSVDSGD